MPSPQPPAAPDDPLDLTTSVAGEEDPGASIDLANVPAKTHTGAGAACPRCAGSGRIGDAACPACGGSGKAKAKAVPGGA